MEWSVEHKEGFVPTVTVQSNGSMEFWVLLRGDAHWDNPDSNRRLMKEHLDLALERNAAVIDLGDFFCAMQGKYDKRSDKSKVRPEHQSGNYLDRLVDTAADWHAPYAHLWVGQYFGNHETSILKYNETCLLTRLAERVRAKTGAVFPLVGYTGFIKFNFNSGRYTSCRFWATHGYGGGGPVTKDMIQHDRQLSYVDSDIYASAHTHDMFFTPTARIRCTASGKEEVRDSTYIKVPSYKDEFKQGKGGFHVEKGRGPKVTGAVWIRFYYRQENRRGNNRLRWDVIPALR